MTIPTFSISDAIHLPIENRFEGLRPVVYQEKAAWHCLHFHALAEPRSAFHARQLNPQHPVAGFCLTHKAESPVVCLQKRDFLSPHPPHLRKSR